MKILIIGGTSFIGPHVAKKLQDRNHDVVLFHRNEKKAANMPNYKHVFGDRHHLLRYKDQLQAIQPDVVLDMIPLTADHAEKDMYVFKGHTARIVGISSVDVYRAYGILINIQPDHPDSRLLNEKSSLRRRHYPFRTPDQRKKEDPNYAMDFYEKIHVERELMAYRELPGTILRLPMVYGPEDRQFRFADPIKRMNDNRPFIPIGFSYSRWRSAYGYVENIAEAIVLAVLDSRAKNQVYTVAEENNRSIAEWYHHFGRVMNWDGELKIIPDGDLPDDMRHNMVLQQDLIVDSSKIRTDLGYRETVSFDESLIRTVRWITENQSDTPQMDYTSEDRVLNKIKSKEF